jgi:plastocyanin
LNSVLSKATFGIGIALAVAAIATIYVSSVTTQRQASISSSQQTSSVSSSTTSNIANNRTNNTTAGGASQLTTQISIPQGAATHQVKIFYLPNPASVLGGAKITWTNQDSAPHTATAADNSFDTGIIQPGSSGSAIIKGQATIPYHCTIHPWMTANLIASSGGNVGQ